VDHIGHAYGPYSDLLPPKLKEMDNVVEFIYNKLRSKSEIQSLIIVCGDHGMTAGGSHGGITKSELLTPLLFINTNPSEATLKNPFKKIKTIDQVDFAPTLSSLLALPIPTNSFGNVIPQALLFCGFTRDQILHAFFHNVFQLFEVYKSVFPKKSKFFIRNIRKVVFNHSEIHQVKKVKGSPIYNYSYLFKFYMGLLSHMKRICLPVWLSITCLIS
ncbi:hypothetical protein CEXT_390811, partial [Caerostris extrusa]